MEDSIYYRNYPKSEIQIKLSDIKFRLSPIITTAISYNGIYNLSDNRFQQKNNCNIYNPITLFLTFYFKFA